MTALPPQKIGDLLHPFLPSPPFPLLTQLSIYLDLLVKWSARTNLTSIRDPAEIVVRHFGESLFAAQYLETPETLLDLGSGAGFPGVPIALLRPDIKVTLAESQHKKASFLREAVRVLKLQTEVWGARIEEMPAVRTFDDVTLRAVDDMQQSVLLAESRAERHLVLLTSAGSPEAIATRQGFSQPEIFPLPLSRTRVVALLARI